MRRWLAVLPLLWIALTLRLYRLDAQDVWWDEARNIDVAARPWTAIASSPELDIHPPLYFYLLHGWMALSGDEEFAVRFLSVLPAISLIPLLYQLGRRLGGDAAGTLAAGLGALSPFLVAEAQETRMYTWTYLWLALAGLSLWRWVRQEARPTFSSTIQRIIRSPTLHFALFSALALLTHYSSLLVLIPVHLLLAAWTVGGSARQRLARLQRWAAGGMLTAFLFVPQLPRAWAQIAPYRNPTLSVPTPITYLAQCWKAFILGDHYPTDAARPWLIAIGAILLIGLLLWLWRAPLRSDALALAFLVVAPLILYYAVLVNRSAFAPRYISFVVPPLLLLGSLALTGWLRLQRALGAVAAIVLIASFVPAQRSDYFDPATFSDDTQGLIAWLEESTGPDDLVLFDVPYPWGYYVHSAMDARYLFVDINTVAERLTAWAEGHERIFWIRWFKSDTDPRGAVPWLLDRVGQQEGQHDFRGYQAAWYRLPEDAVFTLAPGFRSIEVDFGQVALVGFAYGENEGAIGSDAASVWVALRWRNQDAQADYKVSVRLYNAERGRIGQDDRFLISDRHLRARYWQAEEEAFNVYALRPSGGIPAGTTTIAVLVYHPDTLAPLPLVGGDGVEFALGTLTLHQ